MLEIVQGTGDQAGEDEEGGEDGHGRWWSGDGCISSEGRERSGSALEQAADFDLAEIVDDADGQAGEDEEGSDKDHGR